MKYYALRVDGPIGLVRTAYLMGPVKESIRDIRRLIWLVVLSVGVAVIFLTYGVVGRIIRPVVTLTNAAELVAAGDYGYRIFASGRDELGMLGQSFNRMSEELSARERQLVDSRHRLETVLRGMIEGVIAVDDRTRIIFANASAGSLMNFNPSVVEGLSLLEAFRNHTLYESAIKALNGSGISTLRQDHRLA